MLQLVMAIGLVSVVSVPSVQAQTITQATYKLDDTSSLTTSFDEDARAVTVSVLYADQRTIAITLDNANIAHADVQSVVLCQGCDPVLFIPAYDLSSTYGAVTGLVAWQEQGYWSLSILPLARPYLEDADGDGVFSLMDSVPSKPPVTQGYDFKDGLISRSN